ncbi:Calx-beta domain-containing protein [uncultured Sunxiuqinia sp.]|uniref:Calx-beta domain-containing protein n=1 Tax=uncultured Sunxiuqinia sp. TaxID=1573825 RepID=UPI002AA64280|nr:Calx-beta domain-containing protein [uncultured Sunxiuqinia sp.]
MRKLVFLLALVSACVFTSCSDDDEQTPAITFNFEATAYTLASGTVEVKLVASEAVTSEVTVPVILGGDAAALEDEDYSLSAKSFVFQAGEKEASIEITRKNVSENAVDLVLNLGTIPFGFEAGVINYATVEIVGANAVTISFDNYSGELGATTTSFGVLLKNVSGENYEVTADTQFSVEIDAENTTAEEEVHYSFTNGKYITVKAGESTGSIDLSFFKLEEGKTDIALKLVAADGYILGNNPEIYITIAGPTNFSGTWSFAGISNLEWWQINAGTDTSDFPKGTSSDQITFAGLSTEYTVTTNFSGDLKNYFPATSTATFLTEREERLQEEGLFGSTVMLTVLSMTDINVNFSATEQDVRAARVGWRLFTDGDNNEILECTIYDYEPTDFLADVYQMYVSYGSDPVMLYMPLRLHFLREN